MRVDSSTIINGIQGLQQKSVRQITGSAGADGDTVDLSVRAADMKTAMDALDGMPAVRQDSVDSVRQQVQSGEYAVDENALADRIVGTGK